MPRPRTFDEADVVARARKAFAETGYAGTSLDTLLEATGLARQSLYNAFGGKKELFMRAFLSDAAEAVDAVESIRHGSDSPIGRIRAQLVKVAVEHGASQAPPVPLHEGRRRAGDAGRRGRRHRRCLVRRHAGPLRRLHRRGAGRRGDRRHSQLRLVGSVLLRGHRGDVHPRRIRRLPRDAARHRADQPRRGPDHRPGTRAPRHGRRRLVLTDDGVTATTTRSP
ncbi:TetR/AcrR family transcriptional regulator [Curtobacterium sp. MCPF17_052]|uniref:TetR/AcrR family transcriptional regulator n=1 Tax=Curtobacterium sp. MCPF17_052 TaxID=2175655 RepID=UPI0024DF3EDA|nr:TetR/AcrR family transcriptional regulator [Curtobacterium sp. MCPF17_052]WIB11498.1 TetR/AcrR family transcriptional regulator [Curtobacterium sp. MCPF17_052]